MLVLINYIFFTDYSQSSIMAVSELVTTCLVPIPYFKWEYTVLVAVSIMKKYKLSIIRELAAKGIII